MVRQYTKKPIQDRFMAKVSVPNDPDDCWEWKGRKNLAGNEGYGQFWVDGRNKGAHRISYELFCGEITQNMFVCHKCDNRICVNPKHLFLGTNKDNMLDMVKKKRSNKLKGSKHGMSKLNESNILEIRKMLNNGLTVTEIGKQFGVGPNAIYNIKHGKKWSHVI